MEVQGMKHDTIHITNGRDIQVKVTITATASGFEVDVDTVVHGRSRPRHLDVFGTHALAVAAAKTEAARVAAAFLTGVYP
jgi:hypothetical protein